MTRPRGLALAFFLVFPSGCASLGDVQDAVRKVRPLLPEPAGIGADIVSLVLAGLAAKKASSARRRATRRRPAADPVD